VEESQQAGTCSISPGDIAVSDDPWESLVDQQLSNPVKAKLRAAATRAERRAEKQQSDHTILQQQWREWHDQRVKQLLNGQHGQQVKTLAGFLETMTLDTDPWQLVGLIDHAPWHKADPDTRYLVLGLIDNRIIYLRETEGWCPFSDAIPFSRDEPTLFEIIRGRLQS
jgi:hypothetical protein